MRGPSSEFPHGCTLLIPHNTIRTLAEETESRRLTGRTLPWAEWGTRGSAVVHCSEAVRARVALRPFGSMFPVVRADGSSPPPWPAAVVDFSPWARCRGRGASGEVRAAVREMLFDNSARPGRYRELFGEPVRTQLPYAVYAGPRLFYLGNSRCTAQVELVDGGLVAMVSHRICALASQVADLFSQLYDDLFGSRMLGFDTYTV